MHAVYSWVIVNRFKLKVGEGGGTTHQKKRSIQLSDDKSKRSPALIWATGPFGIFTLTFVSVKLITTVLTKRPISDKTELSLSSEH